LGKFVKVAALLLALILPFQASAGVFGYYHTSAEDISATWPHTNLVHVQAANPLTVTLDEAFEIHPNARLAFEFGALAVSMRGKNGCGFGKCLDYDSERTALILDAVETLVEPHHDKMFALMVADEPETNPPTLDALEALVADIEARPALAGYPLWVNLDNVLSWYTGHDFVLPTGIDIFSLTPNYGKVCGVRYCEMSRLAVVMDAIATRNRTGESIKWMVIGDGLGLPGKTRGLYDLQVRMARDRGIEVLGSLAFAYRYPEDFSILSGSDAQRASWVDLGRKIVSGVQVSPETTTFHRWWIPRDYWRFRR
jgi:hypothetical protein